MPGTIGVVNNVAMYTGDGSADGIAYLDLGGLDYSNGRVQMRVVAVEDSDVFEGVGLRFRRQDENNYWEWGHSRTGLDYYLIKVIAGQTYYVARPGCTRADGDLLRVETYEDRINVYLNETLMASVVDTELMDQSTVGMRFSAGCVDSAVDDFAALVLEDDIREELTTDITYQVLVDWDNDGGLAIGEFEVEANIAEWDTTIGSRPILLEQSQEFVHSGLHSMKGTFTQWNLFQFDVPGHGFSQGQFGGDGYANASPPFKFAQAGQGFDQGRFATNHIETSPDVITPKARRQLTGLIPGREYELHAWFWIPEFGTHVGISIEDIDPVVYTTEYNQWQELVFPYTATAETHNIVISPQESNPDTGDVFFVDEILNMGAYEDITCYVLGKGSPLNFHAGRDQARSLASVSPAEVEFNCYNNTLNSHLFSPDNTGSPLYGYLEPGKPVVIRCLYNNQISTIFHGFVDNYTLQPDPGDEDVAFSCIDALQYVANGTPSTEVYPSIQTGAAINVILDDLNWPATKRDIDAGATTMRWWHLEDTDGLTAVQDIIASEGMPAIAYVDEFGNFIFRDRHHRQLLTRSKGIQTTFRTDPDFDEPLISAPLEFNIGWKDIINRVKTEISDRQPGELDAVWSSEDLLVIPAGTMQSVDIKADSPFYGAISPTVGYENTQDFDADIGKDIVLKTNSGAIASINLSRTSGQSTTLELTAGASDVTISRLQLRAFPVEDLDSIKILQEDPESVEKYGPKDVTNEFPWTNKNDMDAIAQVILGIRATRLPIVNIDIHNSHPVRISNIMNRQLSDRIHIQEMLSTFMNDDYFIEVIEHSIEESGTHHITTLGCEKAREQLPVEEVEVDDQLPVFTFDVAGKGFDDGYFLDGGTGLSLTNNLFILDVSKLDEDGLGY